MNDMREILDQLLALQNLRLQVYIPRDSIATM